MRNVYYQLWVDGIVNSKDFKNNEPGWKFSVYWLITVMNGLNLAVLLMWLDFYQIYTYKFQFNVNHNSALLSLLEGVINYVTPFAIVNYYAIFYKNRYAKLITRYSDYNGRLALYYALGSLLLLVGTVIIMW